MRRIGFEVAVQLDSLQMGRAVVSYDESAINPATIESAIADAGYTAAIDSAAVARFASASATTAVTAVTARATPAAMATNPIVRNRSAEP